MTVSDFDIASRAVLFSLAVFGAAFAVLRFVFGLGRKDTTIEKSITEGFAAVRERLDRIERDREEEKRARIAAEAESQRKAIADAVRQAQTEEREKTTAKAISEIRDQIAELHRTKLDEHQEFRDRLTALESSKGVAE